MLAHPPLFRLKETFTRKSLFSNFVSGREEALEEISFNFAILSLRRYIMTTSALIKLLSVVRAGSVGPGVVGKPAILNNDGVPTLMEVVGQR